MSKALQVYDKAEGKVVDIPEDEVESVQNTRLTYFAIQRNVFKSKPATISAREFITGLLQFGITGVENGLKQKPELDEQWKRIWESVGDKIIDILEDITTSEDFLPTNVPKEIFDEEERHVRNAIAYCLIARAFDIWTPKFWRSDAIAAKIREKDQARAEKEKAKAEKRVPVGS